MNLHGSNERDKKWFRDIVHQSFGTRNEIGHHHQERARSNFVKSYCFYSSLVFFLLTSTVAWTQTTSFDPKVVCFQQHRVDSIFRFVKKKKDVSMFFQGTVVDDYFKSRVDLLRTGLTKNKKVTVERIVKTMSPMLPSYEEEHYFEMKDGRVVVVMIGFTAVAKFPDWHKVLNFTVKHWTKEQLEKYKASKGNFVSEEDLQIEDYKIEKVDQEMCK